MPKAHSGDLFHLIRSMTKSEKRHFKLLHSPATQEDTPMYIQLFDALDSMKKYSTDKLDKKLPDLSDRQIINLKRHLLNAILKSLRQLEINKRNDIYISEHIDYARILYDKGLYLQSLRILERLLPLAIESEEPLLQLEIMEFEKYIEARHITRSRRVKDKMESLIARSETMARELNTTVALSNLSLDIHGYYIQNGFVRDNKTHQKVTDYFLKKIHALPTTDLTLSDQIYMAQSFMWYHYITLNLPGVYKYALRWTLIFEKHPRMITKDPTVYMRGLHYLLLACFYAGQKERYLRHFEKFRKYVKKSEPDFPLTSRMLAFVYFTNAKLNRHIMNGDYRKALKMETEILDGIETFSNLLDTHRALIYYYKLAWLHFGVGQHDQALEYLNLIIHRKTRYLRRELQVYAQLLHLAIHLELGHLTLAKYLLRSVKRTLKNSSLKSQTLEKVLAMMGHWTINPVDVNKNAGVLNQAIRSLDIYSYDWRSLTYFDFLDWTDALSKKKTIAEVVSQRS